MPESLELDAAGDEFDDVPMEVSDEDKDWLRSQYPDIGDEEFDKHCKHLVSVRTRDAKRKRDCKRHGPPKGVALGLIMRNVKVKRTEDAALANSTPT